MACVQRTDIGTLLDGDKFAVDLVHNTMFKGHVKGIRDHLIAADDILFEEQLAPQPSIEASVDRGSEVRSREERVLICGMLNGKRFQERYKR